MTARLFTPLQLGNVTVPNRIAIAPMCQYSADDGCANDWHLQHLMSLAMSGAGLVMLEATAVERRGRITHGCLGLYSDANEAALGHVLAAARRVALPGTAFGIQLAHAGRKASSQRPWEGGSALAPDADPWPTIAPSAIPMSDAYPAPKAFTEEDAENIVQGFEQAARRAVRLGFEVIELHMAHGYLMHSILSPLSNTRTDRFGGSLEERLTLPLEIVRRVRSALPDSVSLGARITGQDWLDGGLTVEDAATIARHLKANKVDWVCVSSGGLNLNARVVVGPGYQVPFARHVRENTGIITRAVGLIATPQQAEEILAAGSADQIAIGRAALDNPRWGWHAAETFGVKLTPPPQYARAIGAAWPGAKIARPN